MQRTEFIDKNQLFGLIEYILSDSKIEFYESYSEMEKEIVQISKYSEFLKYFENSISENKKQLKFGIYYPEAKGKFYIDKIKLNPKYCNGKTYRYNTNGWGVIYVHLDLQKSKIECRVSVNSKTRAQNWTSTNPEFGNPELWEWKIVENNARKIITRLKKTTHNKTLT
ncbi:hypothetical protein [uncultured Dokdonia sp.]|uniref:hypothetical protein n=1 Tax=uncultured Dokdonia sp. TaxID=575653 RepID=UPI002623B60E|nr:hypothetical protein [uncultured Dokdonia sp.]